MSASVDKSAIFINDTPAQIKNKINKYSFSGGGDTIELHKANGGNTDVDVAYQYLTFFLEDDEELEKIGVSYRKGELSTSELKKKCISCVSEFLGEIQKVK